MAAEVEGETKRSIRTQAYTELPPNESLESNLFGLRCLLFALQRIRNFPSPLLLPPASPYL